MKLSGETQKSMMSMITRIMEAAEQQELGGSPASREKLSVEVDRLEDEVKNWQQMYKDLETKVKELKKTDEGHRKRVSAILEEREDMLHEVQVECDRQVQSLKQRLESREKDLVATAATLRDENDVLKAQLADFKILQAKLERTRTDLEDARQWKEKYQDLEQRVEHDEVLRGEGTGGPGEGDQRREQQSRLKEEVRMFFSDMSLCTTGISMQ